MHLTNKEILKLFNYSEDLKHHYQLLLLHFHIKNRRNVSDSLRTILSWFILFFRLSLKPFSRKKKRLSTPFNYPIPTQNWKRRIISSNLSNEIHLVFGTLKPSKKDFYRSEHQKRKDEICPFSILAFLQPITVDKEPLF